jgi:hypothetical protein
VARYGKPKDRQTEDYKQRVKALNDQFRRSFSGGQVMMTAGVAALEPGLRAGVLEKVRAFEDFDDDNDPWGEHDFIGFEIDGQTFFGKIDYYAHDMKHHSDDPADAAKTVRVLTIMLAEEY